MFQRVVRDHEIDITIRDFIDRPVHFDAVFLRRVSGDRIQLDPYPFPACHILEKEPSSTAEIQYRTVCGDVSIEFRLIRPSAKLSKGRLPAKICLIIIGWGGLRCASLWLIMTP